MQIGLQFSMCVIIFASKLWVKRLTWCCSSRNTRLKFKATEILPIIFKSCFKFTISLGWFFLIILVKPLCMEICARGKSTFSYTWTGWGSWLQDNYRSFLEESLNHTPIQWRKFQRCQHESSKSLKNIRISTDYAQKFHPNTGLKPVLVGSLCRKYRVCEGRLRLIITTVWVKLPGLKSSHPRNFFIPSSESIKSICSTSWDVQLALLSWRE